MGGFRFDSQTIWSVWSARCAAAPRKPSPTTKLCELQHDRSVVFYKYNERGLEIERATFSANWATATTRPCTAKATVVMSIQWHDIEP